MADTQCRMSDHDGGETQSTCCRRVRFLPLGDRRNAIVAPTHRFDRPPRLRRPCRVTTRYALIRLWKQLPLGRRRVLTVSCALLFAPRRRPVRVPWPAPPACSGASELIAASLVNPAARPLPCLFLPYVGTNQSKWRSRYECASTSAIEVGGPRFGGAWRPGKRRCGQWAYLDQVGVEIPDFSSILGDSATR